MASSLSREGFVFINSIPRVDSRLVAGLGHANSVLDAAWGFIYP